jgi:transposase
MMRILLSSLDKSSVRDEVARLKADFNALRDAGKITLESQVLMNSMFMIVELILSIFLEKMIRKQSKNSSIPPSQTGKDDTAVSKPGSQGKGQTEHAMLAANARTVEQVSVVTVPTCEACGQDLCEVACRHYERRTHIDIVFEKVVEHIDAEVKQCPNCDSTVKAIFPTAFQGPLQYGDGLKAFVVNLLVCQMVSLNRTQKLLKSMVGEVLAEASLLKFILRLHQALEHWEQQAIEDLLDQPCLHVDETSLRVDRQNHWIHGLCGSHLLRELTFMVDAHDYRWAKRMKRLLQKTCHEVSRSTDKYLSEKGVANVQKRYRCILTQGDAELPPMPDKPSGKRGRIAKSDAHNLLERLRKYETAVLLFAQDSNVPFTNNRAERDLRMAKVKQKVSGCFRSELYAQAYCRISSYVQTMQNKGYNPLLAIQLAFAGQASALGGE